MFVILSEAKDYVLSCIATIKLPLRRTLVLSEILLSIWLHSKNIANFVFMDMVVFPTYGELFPNEPIPNLESLLQQVPTLLAIQ
ncbi:MAG TPA: hypothetical protein VFD56_01795, partial [Chitinophagaceae bacterium]|nr:hypothetical protein [Chitinophagaceae bacterium]